MTLYALTLGKYGLRQRNLEYFRGLLKRFKIARSTDVTEENHGVTIYKFYFLVFKSILSIALFLFGKNIVITTKALVAAAYAIAQLLFLFLIVFWAVFIAKRIYKKKKSSAATARS